MRGQSVASAYDVVWGGIKPAHRPPRPLSQMTVREVLAWQDSIDRKYMSEAAGRYQIMEDTLRDLVNSGAVNPNADFNADTQNGAAFALMMRRGWANFVSGDMSLPAFGDSLAREWASLPVLRDQQGAKGRIRRGQSYYARDGLNKSHLKPAVFEAALRSVLDGAAAPEIDGIERLQEIMKWVDDRPDGYQKTLDWLEGMPV